MVEKFARLNSKLAQVGAARVALLTSVIQLLTIMLWGRSSPEAACLVLLLQGSATVWHVVHLQGLRSTHV
jgi:hypothetical protein